MNEKQKAKVWYQRDAKGNWRQYFPLSDGEIYEGGDYGMDIVLISREMKMFGRRGDYYVMRYY